jgi:hypothetical protein
LTAQADRAYLYFVTARLFKLNFVSSLVFALVTFLDRFLARPNRIFEDPGESILKAILAGVPFVILLIWFVRSNYDVSTRLMDILQLRDIVEDRVNPVMIFVKLLFASIVSTLAIVLLFVPIEVAYVYMVGAYG